MGAGLSPALSFKGVDSNLMHARGFKLKPEGGFTILETLLTIVFFSIAIVGVMELFMAITKRTTEASVVQRDSRGPEHVVSLFSSALTRATRCSLYPDRSVFAQYPALGGAAGNFAVLWFDDGASLAFELANSELRIVENPNTNHSKERLFATGVEAAGGLCAFYDGLTAIRFLARIGAVQREFRFCARMGWAQ